MYNIEKCLFNLYLKKCANLSPGIIQRTAVFSFSHGIAFKSGIRSGSCLCKVALNYLSKRTIYNSQPYFQNQALQRLLGRRTKKPAVNLNALEDQLCTTYATADHYKFLSLIDCLSKDLRLQEISLPIDALNSSVFAVSSETLEKNNQDGYIVLFREGVISFWNCKESLIKQILRLVKKYEVEPYKVNIVHWENERMKYRYISGKSRLQKNCFEISESESSEKVGCDIYAFSHALMTSVKLAHWEHSLDDVVRSIESLPRILTESKSLNQQTSKSVLKKLGKVLTIRHRLNLQYNMLEVPDVYWDEEELESLYIATTQFLNIQRRVKVMNEKLSYCCHVIELVKSHISESKSIRIEIWIVVLIMIEVLFELFHFYVKPFLEKRTSKK